MISESKIDMEQLTRPKELSREALKRLIKLVETGPAKFIGWEQFGKPAIDRVIATVEVPVHGVGQFMQDAFAIGGLRSKVHGFPRGVLATEAIELQIDAHSGP